VNDSASSRPSERERTSSAAETEAVGAALATSLEPGDVVLVTGELGAGKTTLVRGAARALGVEVPITSPTFTIGQRYPARGAAPSVSHLDLYRLGDLSSEDPELLADYINPGSIAFVEWPEGHEAEIGAFGRVAVTVSIAHAGGDRRTLYIRPGQ
jgi:tRNA threonylcarbamoyladenosine biosynthesis protein TsaE